MTFPSGSSRIPSHFAPLLQTQRDWLFLVSSCEQCWRLVWLLSQTEDESLRLWVHHVPPWHQRWYRSTATRCCYLTNPINWLFTLVTAPHPPPPLHPLSHECLPWPLPVTAVAMTALLKQALKITVNYFLTASSAEGAFWWLFATGKGLLKRCSSMVSSPKPIQIADMAQVP